MMYKAKVAVCSDIRTKHSMQSEGHVEFLNVKPWWYGKKPLGVKRLRNQFIKNNYFPVALRPVFGWWPPFTELKDYTHLTNHTR
jgi:hypothetical protein